jgi:hypothetical protein
MNTGDLNCGNCNSGYGNVCDFSSGAFCTVTPKMAFFDLPSALAHEDWACHPARPLSDDIMRGCVKVQELTDEQWMALSTIPNWDKEKFVICVEKILGARKGEGK